MWLGALCLLFKDKTTYLLRITVGNCLFEL